MAKVKKVYWKDILLFIWEVQFPYLLLIPIYEILTFDSNSGFISKISLVFAIVFLALNIILTVIFQILSLKRLFQKYVDKETRNKVMYNVYFVFRRIFIVGLLLFQNHMDSFNTSFTMFTINTLFLCVNIKYTQNRMDFMYYSLSEIPVVIFGFIIITFTSYNLDIYAKQMIGVIGISLIMIIYILFVSLRVHEFINFHKEERLKKEQEVKKNTTNKNMMREPYNSGVEEEDNGVENIRDLPKEREFEHHLRAMKLERTPQRSGGLENEEEYKF